MPVAEKGFNVTEDTRGVHLWLILMKAHRAMMAFAARNIRSLELNYSDFGILEALLHKGPLPVNRLGPMVGLTTGSISVAIDRLEEKKLASRAFDDADRRVRVVQLTARGRALISRAFARHEEALEKIASPLSRGERIELMRLLKKLGRAAEDYTQES